MERVCKSNWPVVFRSKKTTFLIDSQTPEKELSGTSSKVEEAHRKRWTLCKLQLAAFLYMSVCRGGLKNWRYFDKTWVTQSPLEAPHQ